MGVWDHGLHGLVLGPDVRCEALKLKLGTMIGVRTMDPDMTLKNLWHAIQDMNPNEMEHYAKVLADWLRKGGFEPDFVAFMTWIGVDDE